LRDLFLVEAALWPGISGGQAFSICPHLFEAITLFSARCSAAGGYSLSLFLFFSAFSALLRLHSSSPVLPKKEFAA